MELIEFEYFLVRRPSEILKHNPHLKQTTVYRICKNPWAMGCTLSRATFINMGSTMSDDTRND